MEDKHTPELVAHFLMRCLFTMFAEDVQIGGFQRGDFTRFLMDCRGCLDMFVPMLENLWREMDTGGPSVALRKRLKRFNGGLFHEHTALPVTEDQLELLIEAAEAKWNDVEPAIFGTLLERALDTVERHKLGAHYTPRAYVERLVMPTIVEPLREQWDTAYAAAVLLSDESESLFAESQTEFDLAHKEADTKKAKEHEVNGTDMKRKATRTRNEAIQTIRNFHDKLCETLVLDPACGSGNFLYVSLELMKKLEGEVIEALRHFGDHQQVLQNVDPHQFLGIEVNPRAAAITDLVLWIGYLQWHFRTRGNVDLPEPIIRNFHNIECRDAVLDWDEIEPVVDDDGKPITRWDGRTTKKHPVTGKEVPDETARVQELRYINPRRAEWPRNDYIVGNPPFVGIARMRDALGDGYTTTIRRVYDELPESIDFVMYWWHHAANSVREHNTQRFGLITTNSVRQTFNRRVLTHHLSAKNPVGIVFAIPDHPWVDSVDGADVRISMTVGLKGETIGQLLCVRRETSDEFDEPKITYDSLHGAIQADLTIGPDTSSCFDLKANDGLGNRGVQLIGAGFIINPDDARKLGLGRIPGIENHIRPYRNGRDIAATPRNVLVIDLFGLGEEDVRRRFPDVYQWVLERVKPGRDENNRESYRKNWWIFGEPVKTTRKAIAGLEQYIVTCRTAKHRTFTFLSKEFIPDAKLITIALQDSYHLGVLSSRVHVTWADSTGAWLGVGNDSNYNHSECFAKFPFPAPDAVTEERIRSLGEQLDSHRKQQQQLHPDLTMTGMYNVLEKLRADEKLTAKDQKIHEQGLVSVLKQIHDGLDVAVFDAYGWSHDLTDGQILQKLVDLNHERAAEEAAGKIHWLRPDFQNPSGDTQKTITVEAKTEKPQKVVAAKVEKQAWPVTLPEKITAVRNALTQNAGPATAKEIDKYFKGGRNRVDSIEELLETLVAVGQARRTDDGRYVN